jgi:Replication-relaxation
MEAYNLDTFRALDRYRYLRSNFIAGYHNAGNPEGSMQHRKRDLGPLRRKGLLALPKSQEDSKNYRYCTRVYELTPKSKAILLANGKIPTRWSSTRDFWHQLMIADIVMSIEIACKQRGLRFRHRREIIGDTPFNFESYITYKSYEPYDGSLRPDELFAINETYFVLEADRQTEPVERANFESSSYLRKILQYRDVLKSKSYKTLIPNMIVLNITISPEHSKNIMRFMEDELTMSSSSMLFMGIEILGSRDRYPQPLTDLLDLPFQRVGYDNFIISQEV